MKEYGYTSESVLFAGDWMLLDKAMAFTRGCVIRGLIKSIGDQIPESMKPTQPEAAVAFLMETFTPAERAAVEYEITSAKPRLSRPLLTGSGRRYFGRPATMGTRGSG